MNFSVEYDEKVALFSFYSDAFMFYHMLKARGINCSLSKANYSSK